MYAWHCEGSGTSGGSVRVTTISSDNHRIKDVFTLTVMLGKLGCLRRTSSQLDLLGSCGSLCPATFPAFVAPAVVPAAVPAAVVPAAVVPAAVVPAVVVSAAVVPAFLAGSVVWLAFDPFALEPFLDDLVNLLLLLLLEVVVEFRSVVKPRAVLLCRLLSPCSRALFLSLVRSRSSRCPSCPVSSLCTSACLC